MHTRDEVRTALEHNFKLLMDGIGQLTEDELTANTVAGMWTAKDIIAHVWDWCEEANHTAKAWQGARPWQQGVAYDDAWNESHVAARRGLPLINVVEGITASHRRMTLFLELADDETLAAVGRASWGDEMTLLEMLYEMAGHYADHAQNLGAYQKRCLGSEDERKSVGCD